MKLIVGKGYPEVYKLENANGKTIDMIVFDSGKDVYCSYTNEINDPKVSTRVFEKSGLRFFGTLYKYSKDTLVCIDT